MKRTVGGVIPIVLAMLMCVLAVSPGSALAATDASKILEALGRESGLFVVLGCGGDDTPQLAVDLGKNGNSLVHVIAMDYEELAGVNGAVVDGGVKGSVTVEHLGLAPLPYRDYMVNVMVVMDWAKAAKAGLTVAEAKRCIAPGGKLITCQAGKVKSIDAIPVSAAMDVWTHRYHGADGLPVSNDKVFDLPLGFRWSAGLPMNFDNPERSANRYSSTRALVLNDGRCFTFSTGVCENLGAGWKSKYGTDQFLTCRDAFNGRLLWRKRIGDTYYGGLYIENLAPMISIGRHVYLAGENGKMLVVSTRTGKTLRELPTTHIPGVIAASKGVVVAATWKGGKSVGSVRRYDRRRMDWAISEGTIEAYDDASGKRLWARDLLGTSLLICDGRVFIVNRGEVDPLEEAHNRRGKTDVKHPGQKVIALALDSGDVVWAATDESFKAKDQALSLEAAGFGAVAVGYNGRKSVALLSAADGKVLDAETAAKVGKNFFRFRNHVCTPVLRVGEIHLTNRGGTISKGKERQMFGGARAGCLTGTVPAYGAGYITQNWCRCSPAQIPGLLAVAPIGKIPTPAEMEVATTATQFSPYDDGLDGIPSPSTWSSFRGNAARSSSVASDISAKPGVVWAKTLVTRRIAGTVQRDWRSFLNTRLTAPVTAGGVVIVGDIDHNEIIAVDANDGTVRWRFMTAGRMAVAPTLHKGICLATDRTGYVYAIKIMTGQLIYTLRIAPFEKRMVSYGKVESVWPVIGGVMVAGGKAYASAGRTQGSDGGLLVRSFVPETGKVLWSKAVPQTGNGLKQKQLKRNDTLALRKSTAMVMGHSLDLAKGDFVAGPAGKDQAVTMGLEGLYSWNWTRLGHRKFMNIGFGGAKGDTVSWSKEYVAVCDARNTLTLLHRADGVLKRKWVLAVAADRQVTSLILCNNVVVLGGAIIGEGGKVGGFVQAIDIAAGKPVWDKTCGAKLAFNGLAIDAGMIVASFDDGSVMCLR